jgi:hypothetical protein
VAESDVTTVNGRTEIEAVAEVSSWDLPDVVHLSADDAQRVPSPGTLRTLKAQTGRGWSEMMGGDADDADRFQTTIWVRLRKDFPGLPWSACDDVELVIDAAPEGVADPLGEVPSTTETSPRSADFGG